MSVFGVFPYFPAFGLNTERYSKCWKIRTRDTPNKDTFHTVKNNAPRSFECLLSRTFIKVPCTQTWSTLRLTYLYKILKMGHDCSSSPIFLLRFALGLRKAFYFLWSLLQQTPAHRDRKLWRPETMKMNFLINSKLKQLFAVPKTIVMKTSKNYP